MWNYCHTYDWKHLWKWLYPCIEWSTKTIHIRTHKTFHPGKSLRNQDIIIRDRNSVKFTHLGEGMIAYTSMTSITEINIQEISYGMRKVGKLEFFWNRRKTFFWLYFHGDTGNRYPLCVSLSDQLKKWSIILETWKQSYPWAHEV